MKPEHRDFFEPIHEPARSLYRAFGQEASNRNGRTIEQWLTAECNAMLTEAAKQAVMLGLRAPTLEEIVRAERYACGSADYGAKWAYGIVDIMIGESKREIRR
jgi:lysophospholipase L1-like esterase